MATAAILFDGEVAEAQPVLASTDGCTVALAFEDGRIERIDPALLNRVDGAEGAPRFSRSDISGWRLRFAAEVDADLAAVLPRRAARYGRWIDRIGLAPAAGAFAIAAALVVAIGYSAPAWVAPLIPEQWERNLGAALRRFLCRRRRLPRGADPRPVRCAEQCLLGAAGGGRDRKGETATVKLT
jgi:hypothetical protein